MAETSKRIEFWAMACSILQIAGLAVIIVALFLKPPYLSPISIIVWGSVGICGLAAVVRYFLLSSLPGRNNLEIRTLAAIAGVGIFIVSALVIVDILARR
jgi:hypothetical protein